MLWSIHGDGRRVLDGDVVAARERLNWPLMIGFGAQHLLAAFGAIVLVPTAVGLPASTALLLSGVGTLLFLLLTRNRIPAYIGSSLVCVGPLTLLVRQQGVAAVLGGVLASGLVLVVVGVAVKALGIRLLDSAIPPIVAGGIVLLAGLGLAPSASAPFQSQPLVGAVTTGTILLCLAASRGMVARFAIVVGAFAGWLVASLGGGIDRDALDELAAASWFGLPELHVPVLQSSVVPLVVPVVIIVIAQTIAQVKAVATVTGRNLDGTTGDALIANGLSTTLAGAVGGVGTVPYAHTVGLITATRVYSTAACALAAVTAMLLAFSPKVTALINTMPAGVMGGIMLPLVGLVGLLGIRIWLDNRVNIADPMVVLVTGVGLVAGLGDLTISLGGIQIPGIAWGAMLIVVLHPIMRRVRAARSRIR